MTDITEIAAATKAKVIAKSELEPEDCVGPVFGGKDSVGVGVGVSDEEPEEIVIVCELLQLLAPTQAIADLS